MNLFQEFKLLRFVSKFSRVTFSGIFENNGIFSKFIFTVSFLASSYFFANMSISMASDYFRFDYTISYLHKTELNSFVFPNVVICSDLFRDLGLIKFLIGCEINKQPCNYTHFEDIEMYDPFYDVFVICNKFKGIKDGKQDISHYGYGSGLKIQLLLQSNGESVDKVPLYITEQGIKPFYENNYILCKGGTRVNIELQIESEKKLGYPYR